MTVKEIIVSWLKEKGYSGLCNLGEGCDCEITNLIPYDDVCEFILDCEPGYRVLCTDECKGQHKFSSLRGEEGQWHIQGRKPEEVHNGIA